MKKNQLKNIIKQDIDSKINTSFDDIINKVDNPSLNKKQFKKPLIFATSGVVAGFLAILTTITVLSIKYRPPINKNDSYPDSSVPGGDQSSDDSSEVSYRAYETGFINSNINNTVFLPNTSSDVNYLNLINKINNDTLNDSDKKNVNFNDLINYFDYDFDNKSNEIKIYSELAKCPWNDNNYLGLVAVNTPKYEVKDQKNNIVFFLDNDINKNDLNLFYESINPLINNLDSNDVVSIVVNTNKNEPVINKGLSGDNKISIRDSLYNISFAIEDKNVGKLQKAYEILDEFKIEDGNNSIIYLTNNADSNNLGFTDRSQLLNYIKTKKEENYSFNTICFNESSKGLDVANKYGKNYVVKSNIDVEKGLLDIIGTAHKIYGKELSSTLEVNPQKVDSFRLLANERFINGMYATQYQKSLSEVLTNYTQLSLFEIVPNDIEKEGYIFKAGIEYKDIETNTYKNINIVEEDISPIMSENLEFSSYVLEFGLILKENTLKEDSSLEHLKGRINTSYLTDLFKQEFAQLINN